MVEYKNSLTFLKLGGSLITEKDRPMTPRLNILERVMREIGEVIQQRPGMRIILGHGSGSFGHSVGKQYKTRAGVHNQKEWEGFYEVYKAAKELNQLVVTAGQNQKLPIIPFPLCTNATTHQRVIQEWNLSPLNDAFSNGFIPLVYGDVVFDDQLGGTILSTEEIFDYLADELKPDRILLAGIEPGIWEDYPINTKIIKEIKATTFKKNQINLEGSSVTDVTGGMKSKVGSMLEIIRRNPTCSINIFSGLEANSIKRALIDKNIGTLLRQ